MKTIRVLWELFQWVGWIIVIVQNRRHPAVQRVLVWVGEQLRKWV